MPTEKTISSTEFAKRVQISDRTARQWIKDGYVKAEKLNPSSKSVYQIPVAEVDRILKQRKGAG
jgi:predicted site-specific integrase-resolvase